MAFYLVNTEKRTWAFAVSIFCAVLLGLCNPQISHAHSLLDAKTCIAHVANHNQIRPLDKSSASSSGVRIFIRIPGPFAYAEALSRRTGPVSEINAPFLVRTMVRGAPLYRLDKKAIAADRQGFAKFMVSGYRIMVNGREHSPTVLAAAYYTSRKRPHFNDLISVMRAFAAFKKQSAGSQAIFVGDSILDLDLWLADAPDLARITIHNTLPAVIPPKNVRIETLRFEHRFSLPRSQVIKGCMPEPVVFPGSGHLVR